MIKPPAAKLLFLLLATCQMVLAEDTAPTAPATQIAMPDTLVSAEKFDRPEAFAPKGKPGVTGWMGGIGTWSIKDGAAYAVQEAPSKNRPNGHEAVCEHLVDLGDYVLAGEFKLGASPQVGFVCRDANQPNLHQGRVMITPTAIWIQKMSGIGSTTRREELKRMEVKIDPATWHRITVEVCGDKFVVRIDDHVLEGAHERLKDRKGRIGFVAKAEGAQFRNLAIWSAKPKG
ncbi:MAG TPA: family 16 glycoside hydrolase [Prosthecobacter sp.]